MPLQGPNAPTVAASTFLDSPVWVDPENILAVDSTQATVSCGVSVVSEYLRATGFQFAIQTGSTILGIVVELNDLVEPDLGGAMGVVYLTKNGTSGVGGPNVPVAGAGWQEYGNADDLWGTTWTPAEINDPNFGLLLAVGDDSNAIDCSLEAAQITVYFNPPLQAFRPDADIVTTGWATAPLWSKIEEVSADGTVISGVAS